MKSSILCVLFFGFYMNSFAQIDKKHLSPIVVKQNFLSTKYSYNGQKIESPYGLQIPMMQLQDTIVNKNYIIFKKSRNTAKIIKLLSAGFSLYAFFNRDRISNSTYWITVGSIGMVSGYYNIRSDIHLDKAVKRYNKVISGDKIGFYYDRSLYGSGILGVGILHSF